MATKTEVANFEDTVLTHLDSAYNLARWLTRNATDAEDVVQEACLRAFKFFGGFRGVDGRAWLLTIVRNTAYTWMQHHRVKELTVPLDESTDQLESHDLSPELLVLRSAEHEALRLALEELPIEFREVLVLRELEELSYKEIAGITEVPVGTVMSRLARGRKRLQQALLGQARAEVAS